MLKVYAKPYVRLGAAIREVRAKVSATSPEKPVSPTDYQFLLTHLADAKKACENLGMKVCATLFERKRADYVAAKPKYTEAKADFKHLEEAISAEIGDRWLLVLNPHLTAYYEHGPNPFGVEVAAKFPSAAYDVRETCKCLGLERDTAAVFHAMRVLEKGIIALAKDVGTPLDPAYENWENVLDQIDKAVEARYKGMAKGAAKAEMQQRYVKATAEFRHFQVAWRNHVAHGRGQYDAHEAE